MSQGKFIKFAGECFIGGKNVALYETEEDDVVLAVAETCGGKTFGKLEVLAEVFDAPLSASKLAEFIEDLSGGRVTFDWAS